MIFIIFPILILIDHSERDDRIIKTQAAITAGMSANARQLEAYLKSWGKYRPIWENIKDYIIQRYRTANTSVSTFDADIQRYTIPLSLLKEFLQIHTVCFPKTCFMNG